MEEPVGCKLNCLQPRTEYADAWARSDMLLEFLAALVIWVAGGVPYKRQGAQWLRVNGGLQAVTGLGYFIPLSPDFLPWKMVIKTHLAGWLYS